MDFHTDTREHLARTYRAVWNLRRDLRMRFQQLYYRRTHATGNTYDHLPGVLEHLAQTLDELRDLQLAADMRSHSTHRRVSGRAVYGAVDLPPGKLTGGSNEQVYHAINDALYVICHDDLGAWWFRDGKRVDLLAVDALGDVQWVAHPGSLLETDIEAAGYFLLGADQGAHRRTGEATDGAVLLEALRYYNEDLVRVQLPNTAHFLWLASYPFTDDHTIIDRITAEGIRA